MVRSGLVVIVTALIVLGTMAYAQGSAPLMMDDMEGPEWRWDGLLPDNATVNSGRFSGKWQNMAQMPAVMALMPDKARAAYDRLEMAVHSGAVTGATFAIVIYADNPVTPGHDCYVHKVVTDWAGWRSLRISRDDFESEGQPLGWEEADEIRLSATEWGCTPKTGSVLCIDDLWLTCSANDVAKQLVVANFEAKEDADIWAGITQSQTYVKAGEFSGRWDMCDSSLKYAKCAGIPHDWSKYSAFSFWAYSPKATGADAKLMLYSSEAEDDTSGYFARMKLNWTGWSHFVIPKWQFEKWHTPAGWQQIDSVMFVCRNWGLSEPPPGSELYFDEIAVINTPESEEVKIDDFEGVITIWKGFEPTSELAHSGKNAILWSGPAGRQAGPTLMPSDWSNVSALTFWAHSEQPSGGNFAVFLFSRNPDDKERPHGYLATVAVNWEGWQKVELPCSTFDIVGVPGGWGSIDSLLFSAREDAALPDLAFDDFTLVLEKDEEAK